MGWKGEKYMKKLLSFLGAIGLVATSSATVVACGPDNTSTTGASIDYKDGLTVDDLTKAVKDFEKVAEDTDTVKSVVTFYADETVVTIADDGTISAKLANEDSPEVTSFEASTSYVYAVVTTDSTKADAPVASLITNKISVGDNAAAKASINDIKVEVKVGDAKAATETKIADAIKAVSADAVVTTDFTIDDATVFATDTAVAGTITVTAVEGSKLIEGSFTIEVKANEQTKTSINDIKVEVKVGDAKAATETKIADAIKAVSADAVVTTDFTIDDASVFVGEAAAVDGTITVNATASSILIEGSFTITVGEQQ
jgi:folate-dependent phosphoribosylglycinamide formyltransferase PurN